MFIVFIRRERWIKRDMDKIDETAEYAEYAVYVACVCSSN